MKKLILLLLITILSSPVFAMSSAPKKITVSPDVLIDNTVPGVFSGSTVQLNLDYISLVDIFLKSDGVDIQLVLGEWNDLSYCKNLPSDEIGKVGKVSFDAVNNTLKTWVNPKTNILGKPALFNNSGVRLNPKHITKTYKYGSLFIENKCGIKSGSYPTWKVSVDLSLTHEEYDLIKPDIDSWSGKNLVVEHITSPLSTR